MIFGKVKTQVTANLEIFKAEIETDRFWRATIIISILSILAQSSLILVAWGKLPPQIPLFYSRPWGPNLLADPLYLWILPLTVLAITIINLAVGKLLARDNLFALRILAFFNFLSALATFLNNAKIISLLT